MTTTEVTKTDGHGKWEVQETEALEQRQLRLELVTAFHVATKACRFFPRQNESVTARIKHVLNCIEQVRAGEQGVFFEVAHSFLLLNGSRIKTDVAGIVPYNYLLGAMQKVHCGGISFDGALTFEDLREFMYLLASMEVSAKEQGSFRQFYSAMIRQGLKNMEVFEEDTRSRLSRTDEIRQSAVDIYFKSISVARTVLENAHAGKAVNFRRAKRAMQTMVDIASRDRFLLLALTNIKNYDEYTYNHSTNVAVLALTFGQYLGMDRKALGDLGMAAMFHDIGKTEIDAKVLNKPGRLNRDEWELLKSHPVSGVKNLLKSSNMNDMLIRSIIVAFEHHQRVDMSGYPHTEHASNVSFFSRLVSICDVYDALTTSRVYRTHAYSAAEALAIILDGAGKAFDPVLAGEFVRFLGLYPVGTMLRLDTGETAVVSEVRASDELLDRPLVKLIDDVDGNRIEPVQVDLAEKDEGTARFKRSPVRVLAPRKYFQDLQEYLALL
jgi:HD-GYP domain-containing protein (c-di-GMP phosphodiesterase class II)